MDSVAIEAKNQHSREFADALHRYRAISAARQAIFQVTEDMPIDDETEEASIATSRAFVKVEKALLGLEPMNGHQAAALAWQIIEGLETGWRTSLEQNGVAEITKEELVALKKTIATLSVEVA
jgi:hypothetical protein